jgi:mannose-6-phosphate isomerase-like protein (cupin superfamily)
MSAASSDPPASFDRCNLFTLPLAPVQAHGGEGEIQFCRVAAAQALAGNVHFLDLALVPPGASIGRHRHARDEEEFYLVLSGRARMFRDGEEFTVGPGDLVRNRPGGEHGLRAIGPEPVRLFVFEVRVP